MTGAGYAVLVLLVLLLFGGGFLLGRRTARPVRTSDVGTPVEHATFETLHTASLAAPPLRAGLTEESARKSARRLRSLLGTDALCLTDRDRVLVWDGEGEHHGKHVMDQVRGLLASGRDTAFHSDCDDLDCPLRWAVAVPLTVDHRVLGTLIAYAPRESAVLARAAGEVARWVCVQLELAELDRSRTQLIEAEIRALRAQISPHFIFNSLAAIASFVRTDPERARELLLEFADFTRYSFRSHGDFTTLADELHSIDQYLALVRARFGKRLSVRLQVAPEVLPVALPFLCLQPLVENAVKHGLEGAVTLPRDLNSARTGRPRSASPSALWTRAPRRSSSSRTTAPAWIPNGSGRSCAARAGPPPASACSTSTSGCGRCTATTTGSSSRRGQARG